MSHSIPSASHPILTVLSLVSAAAVAPAQAVLTVGPGGYPTVPAALAAANPGAFIDLAPGI